jgi:hypothetical protein
VGLGVLVALPGSARAVPEFRELVVCAPGVAFATRGAAVVALGEAVGVSDGGGEGSGVAVAPATSSAIGCWADTGEGAAKGEWPPLMPMIRARANAVVRLAVARERQWGMLVSGCGFCGPSASDDPAL